MKWHIKESLIKKFINFCYMFLGQQQQQPGGSDVASLNLGGGNNGAPIEVGSSTPVDMGMFGANNQQGIMIYSFYFSYIFQNSSLKVLHQKITKIMKL